MNLAELQTLAASVGFPNPPLAAAIAMAESGGDPSAQGDADLGGSIGLWQIFTAAHPEYDPDQLTDPLYNARAAFAVSDKGSNWTPWTTYRTGAYRQYLEPASSSSSIWSKVGAGVLAAGAGWGSLQLWPHWPLRAWRAAERIVRR